MLNNWNWNINTTIIQQSLTTIGGTLLMVGTQIEPSIGVWVVSVGGAMLTSALGRDQTVHEVLIHIFIGLCWGIFGSQIIHASLTFVPQIAAAFFAAMFGVEATWYFIRSFRTGSITDVIVEVIASVLNNIPWGKITPWVGKKKEE